MRVIRRLVQEEVVDDDALHRREAGGDMFRVGIGLQDVLTLAVEPLELARHGGVQHVGNAQPRLGVDLHAPGVLEDRAYIGILHVAIARQLMGKAPHVAGAPARCSGP